MTRHEYLLPDGSVGCLLGVGEDEFRLFCGELRRLAAPPDLRPWWRLQVERIRAAGAVLFLARDAVTLPLFRRLALAHPYVSVFAAGREPAVYALPLPTHPEPAGLRVVTREPPSLSPEDNGRAE